MTLATVVIERAATLGLRLAVAESLTGGLLCAELVSVPGASRVVSGAVVAYDTALKASLLGVDAELLRDRGPVDAEVAKLMAAGVREACAVNGKPADIGVATTGVAGPDADPQTGQPVGTVWVGVSVRDESRAVLLDIDPGTRQQIRSAAVNGALASVLELLTGEALAS